MHEYTKQDVVLVRPVHDLVQPLSGLLDANHIVDDLLINFVHLG